MVADINKNNSTFPTKDINGKLADHFDSNLNRHDELVKDALNINEARDVEIEHSISFDKTIGESERLPNGHCLNIERPNTNRDREDSDRSKENSTTANGKHTSVYIAEIHTAPNGSIDQSTRYSKGDDTPHSVINSAIYAQLSSPGIYLQTSSTTKLQTTPTTGKAPPVSPKAIQEPSTTVEASATPSDAQPILSTSTKDSTITTVSIRNSNLPPNDFKDYSTNSYDLERPPSSNGEDLSVNAWQKISLLVCAFVILREFHPIESYFVRYLETLDASYTRDVVSFGRVFLF